MEEELHKRVIGQDQAIVAVSKSIRRARAGIKDPKRPTGSFIFLGPSGVGKTELARTLAEFLFGDEDAMIQVDMSEYMEKHSVSRLVGSPPGYVGYDEGGQLTEAVRRKPYSVLLLDEIEKAHPDVFNILLQILEEGKLTDSQGRKVDFRNAIVIMTSNIGAGQIAKNQTLGFSIGDEQGLTYDEMKGRVTGELKKVFRPELLNRIDEIIVFHKLDKSEILTIVDLQLKRLREQMAGHEVAIELTEAAKEVLVEQGFDPAMGARPLRRAIQRFIEDPLADFVLGRELSPGSTILVDRKEGEPTGEEGESLVSSGSSRASRRPRRSPSRPTRPPKPKTSRRGLGSSRGSAARLATRATGVRLESDPVPDSSLTPSRLESDPSCLVRTCPSQQFSDESATFRAHRHRRARRRRLPSKRAPTYALLQSARCAPPDGERRRRRADLPRRLRPVRVHRLAGARDGASRLDDRRLVPDGHALPPPRHRTRGAEGAVGDAAPQRRSTPASSTCGTSAAAISSALATPRRVIADERHLSAANDYVLDNPVRAGLVREHDDWPWSGDGRLEPRETRIARVPMQRRDVLVRSRG